MLGYCRNWRRRRWSRCWRIYKTKQQWHKMLEMPSNKARFYVERRTAKTDWFGYTRKVLLKHKRYFCVIMSSTVHEHNATRFQRKLDKVSAIIIADIAAQCIRKSNCRFRARQPLSNTLFLSTV